MLTPYEMNYVNYVNLRSLELMEDSPTRVCLGLERRPILNQANIEDKRKDMKQKRTILTTLIGVCIVCIIAFSYGQKSTASENIVLRISTPKGYYKLGELIPVSVKITNESSDAVYIPSNSLDEVGIKIATNENTGYKYYVGQGQNYVLDGIYPDIKINPTETISKQKTILWNHKPEVSHLNADAAKPLLKGKILNDYAFSKQGIYFLKAFIMSLKDGRRVEVESEPIQVKIDEPIGEDLAVWNDIKVNGNIGYLIQYGDLPMSIRKTEERVNLQNEVQRIIENHQNSFYSEVLRQSLATFRANEEKRKALKEKYSQKPNY